MLGIWKRKSDEENENTTVKEWGEKSKYFIVIAVCIGLLALLWPMGKKVPVNEDIQPIANKNIGDYRERLSSELASILAEIDGAGHVQVSIMFESEGIRNYATNTKEERSQIQETDRNGAKKDTSEESLISDLTVSNGNYLLIEEKAPICTGVLVISEGAKDPRIKEKLSDATATLLNISPHQVKVVAGKEQ